jgi:flagellar protein FlaF
MNALAMASDGYGRGQMAARTPRGIEYEVIARITHRLKAAAEAPQTDFPRLAAALTENVKLWLALGLDVADPENALPKSLRAQLYYLFEFTDQHTRKVLAGEADPQVLIDINLSVMRGLRGPGGAG